MAATSSPTSRRMPTLAKYDVLEELGHGGMATVYRAHDKRLSRDVAVKVIHPHLRDSKEVQSRFFVEARAVAKLRHPNIVEVFDVSGEDETEQYLVVELLRGKTLRSLLRASGPLPPEVAAALGIELLGALGHAHGAGVVHRDVKPENVILEHRAGALAPPTVPAEADMTPGARAFSAEAPGERIVVKLTDFGIAKLLDAQGVTSTGQVLGSPAHMAPEQIEGGEVDARADVFGMGVLLYECMVGHLPFEGSNPAQVLRRVLDGVYVHAERERPEVGKPFSAILDRALARKADGRFASAADLRDALASELRRVGVASPKAELEAWLDDPEAYAKAHKTRMIAKLCDLGSQARREGKVLAAAADYSRALAYAPEDAQLHRIVSRMQARESRARFARRTVPVVLAVIGLGVLAYYVTGSLKPHGPPKTAAVDAAVAPVQSVEARTDEAPSAEPAVSAPLPRKPIVLPPFVPKPAPTAQPKARRTIALGKIRPVAGVLVAVDGEPALEAVTGRSLTLDTKSHELVFSCVEDLCEPKVQHVGAGEDDTQIEVELRVRPARLTIVGDASKSYAVSERPLLAVQANVAVDVPLKGKREMVHVKELPDGREVAVELFAGKTARAVFTVEP